MRESIVMVLRCRKLLIGALRNESAIDDTEDGIGKRTITIESPLTQSRRNSFQPRLRRATSTAFGLAPTFERVLSNTFGRRRRDGSPSSRRSSQTQMTLPYFTFTPTIGRNSVIIPKSRLTVVICWIDRGAKRRTWWCRVPRCQISTVGIIEYSHVILDLTLAYFFSLLFLSWICLGPWITLDSTYGAIVDSDGVGRGWWAIFTGASLFNDLGTQLNNITNHRIHINP
jgi:Cation transport protein